MSEKMSESEFHEKITKESFNKTWDLIDKKDWTYDEEGEMVRLAYTSSYHWYQIGEPVNFQRGE